MHKIEFKKKEIECNFTYIYNDDLSLVIDVIRHYNRVVFRGFANTMDVKRDFCRMFPFPNPGELPFSAKSGGDWIKMDIDNNRIEGSFQGEPPVSFQLSFSIENCLFCSTTPDWIHNIALLKNLYGFTDLTKALSLLHEDFPIVKFSGGINIGAKSYHLNGARGAIAHHWGWSFPDYVFLMCNGFADPETLLTLSFTDANTRPGINIKGGYLYLRHNSKETKLVSPFQGNIIYFREGGRLCVIARFDEDNLVRVSIDHRKGAAFPHVFNTECVTVMNVECEVEGVGKGNKAILDVKGPVNLIK
jgi:hypothetical protein